MLVYLYSVEDKLAEEYGPPFTAKNDAIARRQFKNLSANMQQVEDFELWKLGTFDTESGEINKELEVIAC